MLVQRLPELEGRVKSLDGLRTISIILVIGSHVSITCGAPFWIGWFGNGNLGVKIFFCISGFIITLLLLKEEQLKGQFSIGSFYKRRALRILPVYYALILVTSMIALLFNLNISLQAFIAAITFTTGWWNDMPWILGHTWSLAVEEQFYLLWPLILLLVKQQKQRLIFVIGFLFLFPMMRVIIYLSPLMEKRFYLSITQGDSILMGCLLAVLLFYYGSWVRGFFTKNVFLIRVIGLLAIYGIDQLSYYKLVGWFTVPLSNSIQSLVIAWLLGTCILKRDLMHSFLNTRTMIFIGTLSYSWYLWQQLFLFECGTYFQSGLFYFPFNLVASFAAALVSYYTIEKFFLNRSNSLRATWK